MAAQDPGAKTYVLVHGGFHGGWCWKEVAQRLRARGHTVYTPTLTGLGERSHLRAFEPTLETFIEDVAQVLRFEDLSGVILVGHSFAGSVVSALADRLPERLRHLVYLDAQLLQSGQAPADPLAPAQVEAYRQRAREGDGSSIPPNAPAYYGITDAGQAAWLAAKLTPHPLRTYFDKLQLRHPLGNGLPATYIACTQPLFPATEPSRALARSLPGWRYLEIATAHDAMLLQPAELSELLAALG
ncbi:MAG TPA: alpha/beta fold hydrolase [Ramlibacter sp.]|nr:alpha/beta fold hydrolase [Ramlibacter sp.]